VHCVGLAAGCCRDMRLVAAERRCRLFIMLERMRLAVRAVGLVGICRGVCRRCRHWVGGCWR
jgi:hypothetical protein